MQEHLLNILACPACLADLSLDPGHLTCSGCLRRYGIKDGIPLLLLKDSRWESTRSEMEGERSLVATMSWPEQLKRNRFINKITQAFLNQSHIPREALILETGGSAGIGAYLFNSYHPSMVLTDIDTALLQVGQHFLEGRMPVESITAAMEWLPFRNDTFDVTFCRQALHHSSDPPASLREMFRVTKPGGTVLIAAEPCVSIFHRFLQPFIRLARRLGSGENRELLEHLADENFRYHWGHFQNVLASLSGNFSIERAHCAPATQSTKEGLVFVPDHRFLLPLARFVDRVTPGGRGYWGSIHIRAVKTQDIQRTCACPENFAPVTESDVPVAVITEEESKRYKEMFPQFFEF